MTLRELINSVDSELYGANPVYQELSKTKPEYGALKRINVNGMDGKIAVTNVHVGSLGDIITYPIEVAPGLELSNVQLLNAILRELSNCGFSDSDELDFWNDFDNLQKAKVVR